MVNLSIRKGTLTEEERRRIENHVTMTRKMLERLPFPKRLSRVVEYSTMHHEKLDGSGYDSGLSGENIPLQARIIAMSDILESLTAEDRPYRKPISLKNAVSIVESMIEQNHLDPHIFNLLQEEHVLDLYAEQELSSPANSGV